MSVHSTFAIAEQIQIYAKIFKVRECILNIYFITSYGFICDICGCLFDRFSFSL